MASKVRGATWDDAETEAVITVWAEDAIQAMLESAKHNNNNNHEEQRENLNSTQDEMDDELSMNGSIASFISEEPGGSRVAEFPVDETPAAEAHKVNVKTRRKSKLVEALDSTIEAFINAQRHSDDRWLAAFKEQQESVQRHQQQQHEQHLNLIREVERNRLQAEERVRKQQQEHEMRLMQMMVQLMPQQPAQLQPLNPASPSISNFGPYQ
ncbi:alpha-protein kinase 1 [Fundulus heteroclitus]|uniref:alpha-protein kinase 1 n=1 Tax=Fundulus heteroclitus TaxID=8078 RepID=UPI00165BCEFB|nr:alpha-protein kinase 1 [Fundulus heteroclitus]